MKDTFNAESLETAACIWEAVLHILHCGSGEKGLRFKAQRMQQNIGTAELRRIALRWTELVDAAWEKVKDSYGAPFDWEFVPEWIAQNIDWSGDKPTYKLEARA